jgi:prevent-host-death family protein
MARTRKTLTLGVRAVRDHFSERLEYVRAGGTVVVTDHGRPVARLVPIEPAADDNSIPARLRRAAESGEIDWDGTWPMPSPPRRRVKLRGAGPSLSEMVMEDRGPR